MIRLENISKWYPTKSGRHYIFKNIDFQIPMDKNIGVLGRNGAGKSTFIRMLGGSEYPSSGNIISDLRISWPLGLQGGIQGSMTGRENARFVARIHGIKNTCQMEAKVEEFAEIGSYFDEPMKSYSSGMRSRVLLGITIALDFDFDVLLIDEITAVGDAKFKNKAATLLKKRFASTRIVMVNHSISQLKNFCSAGLVIHNGGLKYFENIDDAISYYGNAS
ncbi:MULTISPECIES: ABC transporter ATP-binding protein [unclassified Oceanobacter]|jgi:capsular polysaccharide transport system ATP-binding protein|uniref:ABC transporter ATP-binding protein n=1 Tax=unclassified Oceanobacter TaxID=2620260 RepID=UPI0026E38068|nr:MULTISPECIES: ABC transporter ATP-binding protein [unclassified Oceanobacter]MDO6683334.1 ABC transporter ATP-binding protein [Oceanobacter sp. 5_MG-2023]MDP2504134.1 ABC transporter ATP-binding protein [Oceanobacter sp. 3_MG-2023]MDP2546573.1 ABC transporter ATP-binding protein [Oceanobacter sp. 4_MG-2023]MDP2610325.1 ABC transporter ATP-binding protein [Oceanobacter sp. 1_MG-2023]MDP2613537.1 ABC transporter ATP-binding protein [Oceanobacter sp. 2_MG-2023]